MLLQIKQRNDLYILVLEGCNDIDDYKAVLAMMESLESSGNEVCLIVWFDN